MSVYSDLDAMDEGKYDSIYSQRISWKFGSFKNKEMADIKEQTKASKLKKHLKEKTLKRLKRN
jgi:23S rRNA G2445 N2-methylase RlmL